MSQGATPSPDHTAKLVTEGALVRIAVSFTSWAERWFPDAFVFVAIAVIVVVARRACQWARRRSTISRSFGDGFWSLIPFTMQMAFVVIGGYVVATSAPAQQLIAAWPASRRPASARSASSPPSP